METNVVEDVDYLFHQSGKYNLFTTYCIHDNNFYGSDLDLPDKTSSKIDIWHEHSDVLYSALKCSLPNCPKLEIFMLNIFESRSVVSSIIYNTRKDDPVGSERASSGIDYLEIKYTNPAQCYFDLVVARSRHVESIILVTKDWGREYDNSVMDLTGFEKLKSFIYKTSSDNDDDQDNDVVLLKYTNGEEKYRSMHKDAKNPITPCLTILCDLSVVFDFRKNKIEF